MNMKDINWTAVIILILICTVCFVVINIVVKDYNIKLNYCEEQGYDNIASSGSSIYFKCSKQILHSSGVGYDTTYSGNINFNHIREE